MENINIGEQPSLESMTQNQDVEGIDNQTQVENEVENDTENGSLGKFKDTQSLLSAYNNLQAEFTKKCQTLSQLKSKIENVPVKDSTPIYKRQDWAEKVGVFLTKNKEAQPFAKQIAETILQDGDLAQNESALEIAFAKVASDAFVSPNKMVEDDTFVEKYVLKSDKVKNAVLDLFAKQLAQNAAPSVMGQTLGSSQVLFKNQQAKTLGEAKDIVKQMFD